MLKIDKLLNLVNGTLEQAITVFTDSLNKLLIWLALLVSVPFLVANKTGDTSVLSITIVSVSIGFVSGVLADLINLMLSSIKRVSTWIKTLIIISLMYIWAISAINLYALSDEFLVTNVHGLMKEFGREEYWSLLWPCLLMLFAMNWNNDVIRYYQASYDARN